MYSNNSQNYDGPGKTTVDIMNEDSSYLMVDSFSVHGFRLNNGMLAFGPIVVFPTCVLSWINVFGPQDVTPAALSVFSMVHPRPDVVLVGAGDVGGLDALVGGGKKNLEGEKHQDQPVSIRDKREALKRLRATGLNVEVLSTENAISTYNYLCAEGRAVGAALIPPDVVRMRAVDGRDRDVVEGKIAAGIDIHQTDQSVFFPGGMMDPKREKKNPYYDDEGKEKK